MQVAMLAIDFIAGITSTIGGLLYRLLGSIFCRLLDWVQSIFRSLAGLSPILIDGTPVNQGDEKYDIVFWLLQTDIVQDVFWSMVTFSLILMFLMTGLAIIRNAYQDKPKPIGDIISGVFKGLLGMILLPIACMVGLMFGNIILQAVDAGTGASGSQKLSGTLFMSAAYDANICRDGNPENEKDVERRASNFVELIKHTDFEDYLKKNSLSDYATTDVDKLKGISAEEWELLADAIDVAFTGGHITYNGGDKLDPYDTWKVQTCYNLFDVNYVVFVVGGVLMLGFIFKMCFGLIGRIFKLTIDFVLIPVVMAMMPFDTKPSQTWKGDFVKNTTVGYSTVGVMNLFFSILPIVNKIEFSPDKSAMGWTAGIFSPILKLIITIVGLFSAESIISSISGWFGTGDLLKEGKDVYGTFKSGLDKTVKGAQKVTGGIGKYVGAGIAGAKDKKGVFGKIGGFLGGGLAGTAGEWVNKKAGENGFFKGLGEGGKAIKDQKAAGGWHSNFHTKDKQEEMAATASAQKEAKELKELLEKLDQMVKDGTISKQTAEKKKEEAIMNSNLAASYFKNDGTLVMGKDASGKDIEMTKAQVDVKKSELEKDMNSAQDVATFAQDMQLKVERLDVLAQKLKHFNIKADGAELSDDLVEKHADGKMRKQEDRKDVANLIAEYNSARKQMSVKSDKKAELVNKYAKIDSSYEIKIDITGNGDYKTLSDMKDEEKSAHKAEIKAEIEKKYADMVKLGFEKIEENAEERAKASKKEMESIDKKVTEAMKKNIEEMKDVKKFVSKDK